MNVAEVAHQAAPVKSSKLFPPTRVPSFPAQLHLNPVISLIHWIRHLPGLGLSSNGSHGFGSDFWLSSSSVGGTVLVVIVTWKL